MESSHVGQAVNAFDVDQAHSMVAFKVRHLGFSRVSGRFTEFDAHLEFIPGDLSTLEARVAIDASSVDTGDEQRDQHLRSADFFDVENHPEIRFESTGVKNISGDKLTLEGNLTIRGITRRVNMKGRYLGEATDPSGASRVAFEGSTRINRKNYGLRWNKALESGGFLVGDNVEISIDVQGVLRQQ